MYHAVTRVPLEIPRCGSRRHLDEPRVPEVRPGYLLCTTCLDGVENALVDLPDWYVERVGEHGKPSRADLDQVVSDVVDVLSTWCAVVVAQRGVPAPEPPTVELLTGFLAVHMQWLTARPTAAEFADDLMFLDQRGATGGGAEEVA
jgi:hypothetical protein